LVFENLGNERFVNVVSRAGEALSIPHLGRGVAAADFDDDGDLDLALTPINEPSQILENDSPSGHHWLAIKLIGTQGSRDAIGAVVRLETAAGSQIRLVKAGGSYASTSDSRVFFGLGAANLVSRLEIRWPSGTAQVFNDVAVDRFMRFIEPRPLERLTP
jgi:enediyne biosynthesis protein E4